MESQYIQLKKLLKASGYSSTHARKLVFTALFGSKPVTIQELEVELKQGINRASLYRIIALFEKIGVIHRLNYGWKYRIELSDDFNPHHHHMHCILCGILIDFDEPPTIAASIHALTSKYQFRVTNHQFEIEGYCHNCHPIEKTSLR